MTRQTKAELQQAVEDLAAARADADREIAACLAQIATDLPERAADAAKRIAIDQPEVTKALGKSGVAKMRAELQRAAEELGQEFVASADEVEWPVGSKFSPVDKRQVHSALFKRFYGHTGALSTVLVTNGYNLGNSQPFLPQALYRESSFASLAAALDALGAATRNYAAAEKADNDAAVNSLWGD